MMMLGEQVDHPARGGGGWQLDAGPADPGAGRQQGRGQPGQVGACKHIIIPELQTVLYWLSPVIKEIEFPGLGETRSTPPKT